ncbi:MAG: BREX system P-loop protein BrxC [Candidatus Methanoperedens sp.]
MEKIHELFQKDIRRKIEEVIKIDQADEYTVKNEIEEYIVTDSIKDHYRLVLDEYNNGRTSPSEGIGIWISGFFGSGKSSFAKILGYILAARKIMGESASELFAESAQDKRIKDLLSIINTTIPTHAVIFDVSMDRGVRTANERITEVMYKAFLRELGYSEDFDLAELEMTLEESGELEEFVKLYEKTYTNSPWKKAKKRAARAINEASRIRHEMDPKTYPSADSWAKSLGEKGRADISANLLAERTFEIMARRKPGHALIFVIDEVGQYVSRSVEKMLDLQGVVQAFGKEGKNRVKAKKAVAPTWIIVTSQEKLDEVVNYLDSHRIEMARLKDRFPITVDLAPADIAEITSKRVLQKTPEAEKGLGELFDKIQGKLNTNCKLERTSMNSTVTKQSFINFYPYLPHYIDLSIDIISGIRLQPGAQRHIGGSNRTIIKQSQQMLVSEKVNLAEQPIGELVTIDKIYELVEGNLSTEKRKDIADIEKDFLDYPFYLKVAKAVCLLEFTKKLPRTPHNISAVLLEKVDGDSLLSEVEEALKALEKSQYIRTTEEGYKLQTAQERNWDSERRGIEAPPGARNQIKRLILGDIFNDHRVKSYRYKLKTFKIGSMIDEVKLGDEGDIPIQIIAAEDAKDFLTKNQETREKSRDPKKTNDIYLVITLTEEIHDLIEEMHRSEEMISKYERLASQRTINAEESSSLADEKRRKDNIFRELKVKFNQAISNGAIYFQGFENDNSGLGKDLPEILKNFLDTKVLDLYPLLEMGAVKLKGDEAETILTAVNLNGLPQVFYEGDGSLGLVIKQADKYMPNTSAPIAKEVMNYITGRHSYGDKITGKDIEDNFRGFRYGWEKDVLKVVLAALFRAGAIEVTYQGRRYMTLSDPASRQPFINNTAFKAASFAPRKVIDLKTLTDAAKNYEEITGNEVDIEEGAIAQAFKILAAGEKEKLLPIQATISAQNLPGKEFVEEHMSYLEGIMESAPDDCVKMLASEGKSFNESIEKVKKLGEAIKGSSLEMLRAARIALDQKYPILMSRGIVNDELKKRMEDLKKSLSAETFYDRMADIAKAEKEISKFYETEYSSIHKKRMDVYKKAIDDIKGHADWISINEDQQKVFLSPLFSRICDITLPFDQNVLFCSKCLANIAQMESDISAVSSLKSTALDRIVEATIPKEKFERLRISSFFGTSISSKEDLDEGIEKLKEYIEKLLAEGKTVILE